LEAGVTAPCPALILILVVGANAALLPFWEMGIMSEFVALLPIGGSRFSLLRSLVEDLDAIEDFSDFRRCSAAALYWGDGELLDAAHHRGVPWPAAGR
jgi:hypothetical protein